MKRQIRRHVFETNSSSVHSLTFSSSGREPSNLRINQSGEIVVELSEFGGDERIYKDQYSKLQYLITCIWYIADHDIDLAYEHPSFGRIQEAVCTYAGAKSIKITGENGYIDHQSVPACDIEIIDAYDEEQIINFVFNKNIWLKTDHD